MPGAFSLSDFIHVTPPAFRTMEAECPGIGKIHQTLPGFSKHTADPGD